MMKLCKELQIFRFVLFMLMPVFDSDLYACRFSFGNIPVLKFQLLYSNLISVNDEALQGIANIQILFCFLHLADRMLFMF